MLFSRTWLGDHVELPASGDASGDELVRRLTFAGFAVEGIEESGDDVVYDVDVTTNRPDAMCHRGLARELAVLTDRPLRELPPPPQEAGGRVEDVASVAVEDPEQCPRYVVRVIRGIQVGPSPDWLQQRLRAVGLRPVNNVVDVTNFVLWELGQPLHAFDLATLPEGRIVVRGARDGERLTTLDGEDRQLAAGMLLITDGRGPVALGGVMGGEATEVTDATTDVLLESAFFSPRGVRRTARGLGMHTDASHRFERGTDPEGCAAAADRAARLIAELAGGTVLEGSLDERSAEHFEDDGRFRRRRVIEIAGAALDRFAGVAIPADDLERWLSALGCEVAKPGEGRYRITAPPWRWHDLELPADVYEEALRLYGFDRIPATLPAIAGSDGPPTRIQLRRERLRDHLAGIGWAEAIQFAFHDREADGAFPSLLTTPPVELVNPLSERYAVLRRSLVPGLVQSGRFNLRRGAAAVRLFEIGDVFAAAGGGADEGEVDEREHLGLLLGGTVGSPWDRRVELDGFDLKGAVESAAAAVGSAVEARPAELPGVVQGTGAELWIGGRLAGWMGRLEEDEGEVTLFAAEVATTALAAGVDLKVEAPSRFPGVESDLTWTHSLDVPWAEVAALLHEHAPAELLGFRLIDRYQGDGVPEGAVNTTVRFLYGSAERSLTHDEVNDHQQGLAELLERRFGLAGGGA